MKSLHQRVVVLTGAAGGIGRSTALLFAHLGARLALVDRNEAGLIDLAAQLAPAEVRTYIADLRQLDALDDLMYRILDDFGEAHVLINNAGLTVHGAFSSQNAEDIDRVLDVDLRAVLHLTRAFLPALRAAAPAHIVNVSSMAGIQGFPFQSTYSAAKFALRGFGQALRAELSVADVGVSTILPGAIATEFLSNARSYDPHTAQQFDAQIQRFGASPDRVAAAIQKAILRNRAEVRVGWDSSLVALVRAVCPPLIGWVLSLAMRRGWMNAKL